MPDPRQQQLFDLGGEPPAGPPAGKGKRRRPAGAAPAPSVPDTAAGRGEAEGLAAELARRGEGAAAGPQPGDTVYVIDAHSLIYQVFHALPEMTGPLGQPVGAVQGFIRDIVELLEQRKPTYLFCAFDHSDVTFRHALYPEYKAQRTAMPDDLRPQIVSIRRMLEAMEIPVLELPGFEADDVMATLARLTAERAADCVLVTSDKDCRQLISDRVKMYNIRKKEFLDEAALQADWGIRPEQVVDYQALVGDAVDNIPGVPLIGPKLARELLEKYGSLEGIFAHLDEVSGTKRRMNLFSHQEQALLSRRLAKLDANVALELDWAAARCGQMRSEEVQSLCREFGFRSLASRLENWIQPATVRPADVAYRTLTEPAELAALLSELLSQRRLALHVELTTEYPRWGEVLGVALAWRPGEACYLPAAREGVAGAAGAPELLAALRPVWEDPRIEKVGHNLKPAVVALRSVGMPLRGLGCDTMVADYLLAPGERTHHLPDLARRYLHHAPREAARELNSEESAIAESGETLLSRRAAEQADLALQLADLLLRRLADEALERLFRDLEMPLVEVLAEMEYHGIRVDVERLGGLGRVYGERLAALEGEIYALAGMPFNIDSPAQLGKVLFETLALPPVKRTKTGHSTDAEVLAKLATQHPLPAKILEYRQFAKLKGTYVDALPQLVHPRTGRVHTSFKQDVAATGRLSSADPNLQTIPIRTAAGREIRSAFLPGDTGWKLLTADYSQIELRMLAHFSGDPALREAFAREDDVHTRVASEVYGVPGDQVTREMRRSAKAINFGVIYGQSPFGLAKSLQISKDEAARFIGAYFARFAGVAEFIEKVLEQCRACGYVTTILGRRRAIQGVRDPSQRGDSHQSTLPERIAINTVIQGSAADLIKQAMINIQRRLQREKLRTRMLLQIHDELLFESPADELPSLRSLVCAEMTQAFQLHVPLRVDVQVGNDWADCEAEE